MANYDQRAPQDGEFGQLSAGVTSLDTTLSSASFASLPSDLSAQLYTPVTLADDALGVFETVWVTGHGAGSTAVTVLRGREGTTPRAWATGSAWRCAPTRRDVASAYTRSLLPGDGHLGQRAIVTDENVPAERTPWGWRATPLGVLSRGLRTTNRGVSGTTKTRVLEISTALVRNRMYRVSLQTGVWVDGASVGVLDTVLSYTTDGSAPAVTSTVLSKAATSCPASGFVVPAALQAYYTPTTDQTFRLLFHAAGLDGARTYGVYGVAEWPCQLVIEDVGAPVAPSGTSY